VTRPEFCSHKYDVVSGRYLRDIVLTFPADFITRAYASVLLIVELPFLRWDAPMLRWHPSLYRVRETLLRPRIGWGVVIAGMAVLVASAASLRLGFFLLFFLAYFGGYPAIQFQERHHFHLELVTWWAFGFVLHRTIKAMSSLRIDRHGVLRRSSPGFLRATAMAIGGIALTVGALIVARRYQAREAVQLFKAYIRCSEDSGWLVKCGRVSGSAIFGRSPVSRSRSRPGGMWTEAVDHVPVRSGISGLRPDPHRDRRTRTGRRHDAGVSCRV